MPVGSMLVGRTITGASTLLAPGTSNDFKSEGTVVIEEETGARFVVILFSAQRSFCRPHCHLSTRTVCPCNDTRA